MKLSSSYFAAFAVLLASSAMTGCEGEKDLIIIEGNLPIKTSTLYMVGDATPNGWSIDSPTPLIPTEEDPLVFTWEGTLNSGELKLCLTPGSWDAPFIRPMENGAPITKAGISETTFDMHSGDPDNKWKVVEAGIYNLHFDLRNWSMSVDFVSDPSLPEIEPIETDQLYMVGDATPNGWNIDDPTPLVAESKYIFTYEGTLTPGELKLCTTAGSWDVPFIRPVSDGLAIDRDGVADGTFIYTTGPDNKWKVLVDAVYKLTFDLEHYTIKADFIKENVNEKNPIETATLFMIGDATPGGWSMDDATEFTVDPSDRYLFSWEGQLVNGTFKACLERDGTFSCPFLRPSSADCEVSLSGVAANDFVYTTSPDDQWRVTESGNYRITFNLRDWTISVSEAGVDPAKEPIETSTLFMIGDATPGGWSMDNASEFTVDPSDRYIFVWEGNLSQGDMKACLVRDGTFSCPFLRPSSNGCAISASGVAAPDFVFANDPDDKWTVKDAGRYRITFNLREWTITANFLD